jgi:hypothetical protein
MLKFTHQNVVINKMKEEHKQLAKKQNLMVL